MIEAIVLDHLREQLEAPAYAERPKELPASYCLIEKTGTSQSNFISTTVFAVQSYAETLEQAAELSDQVKEAMASLVAYQDVTKVKLESEYNDTNAATGQYRYQAVFSIVHYE